MAACGHLDILSAVLPAALWWLTCAKVWGPCPSCPLPRPIGIASSSISCYWYSTVHRSIRHSSKSSKIRMTFVVFCSWLANFQLPYHQEGYFNYWKFSQSFYYRLGGSNAIIFLAPGAYMNLNDHNLTCFSRKRLFKSDLAHTLW